MAFVNYNAWAEVVCTPLDFVYKIPDDMTFPEAAAFSMNFVAAYMMLFEVANLREGMSVLVHSAGGGVVSLCCFQGFSEGHFEAVKQKSFYIRLIKFCVFYCKVLKKA